MQGGAGADFVKLGQTVANEVRLLTGSQNDEVEIVASEVAQNLTVATGLGADIVSVTGSDVGAVLNVNLGEHSDRVDILRSRCNVLRLTLGDQRDTAIVDQTAIEFSAKVSGDTTTDLGDNVKFTDRRWVQIWYSMAVLVRMFSLLRNLMSVDI